MATARQVLDRIRGLPAWVGSVAWSIALTLFLTWPTVLRMNRAAVGSEHADGMKHLWTLWWIRHELLVEHRLPFQTDLVNYPTGMELYPIEPLNGLLVTLLGFLPIVAAANFAAMLNLTLVGVAGGLLGRELSRTAWGGIAAGTLLQGSAFALFTLHVGVGELQHLWWLPLGLTAWLRLRRDLEWKNALLLGGSLIGATLSCFYHGFFLATGVAVMSLATLWAGRDTPKLLARYAVAAGLALAIVLPVTAMFSTSYKAGEVPQVGLSSYVFAEHGQPVTDPASARLDPPQLVVPRRGDRAEASPELQGYGGGRYLGIPALVLMLGAVVRSRGKAVPWVLTGAVGVMLAMGSHLVFAGAEITTEVGSRIRLPFFFLNRLLGYVSEPLNFPVRFLALTATALAACAALASRGPHRTRWVPAAIALLAVGDVQFNQLIPRPLPIFAPWDYPELEPLADGREPIADLSLAWRADREARMASLSAQLVHQQPLSGVPLERIEYFATDGRDYVASLPIVADLGEAFLGTNTEVHIEDPRRDLALIRDAGYTRLMVLGIGPQRQIPPQISRSMTEMLGPPLIDSERVMVWEVPEIDATEAELKRWRKQQLGAAEGYNTSHQQGPQLR
jgi:hypothetical protein